MLLDSGLGCLDALVTPSRCHNFGKTHMPKSDAVNDEDAFAISNAESLDDFLSFSVAEFKDGVLHSYAFVRCWQLLDV